MTSDSGLLSPALPVGAQPDGLLAMLGDIFNALPVAVLVVDAGGRVVMFNHEAESLLGYRSEDVLGQPVDKFIPDGVRQGHAALQQAYLRNPLPRKMGASRELLAQRADGGLVPVDIALKPILGASGPMVIAAIADMSTHKALEAQALAANAELERRVQERTFELEQSNLEKQATLESLERARAELERLSLHDPLTGLANRRAFDERMTIEGERYRRSGSPLSLAMLDIDCFKRVNDRYGHAFGDEVLRKIADLLKLHCRAVDLMARYGGEEFALAMPDTGITDAFKLCERIRRAIADYPWHELRPEMQLSISIGVSSVLPGELAPDALARADEALYQAKREGRNRVVATAAA